MAIWDTALASIVLCPPIRPSCGHADLIVERIRRLSSRASTPVAVCAEDGLRRHAIIVAHISMPASSELQEVSLMGKLDGKVALVTGSGRNIGRATVLKLAAEGAHVVVNSRTNLAEAEAVAREAQARGVKAIAVVAEGAGKAEDDAMVAKARSGFGRVERVVV